MKMMITALGSGGDVFPFLAVLGSEPPFQKQFPGVHYDARS
jgi:hypothetical protein